MSAAPGIMVRIAITIMTTLSDLIALQSFQTDQMMSSTGKARAILTSFGREKGNYETGFEKLSPIDLVNLLF